MLASILIIALAFVWFLYETNWLRIRLLVGGSMYFTGAIYLRFIFSRALSYSEMADLFKSERHKFGL